MTDDLIAQHSRASACADFEDIGVRPDWFDAPMRSVIAISVLLLLPLWFSWAPDVMGGVAAGIGFVLLGAAFIVIMFLWYHYAAYQLARHLLDRAALCDFPVIRHRLYFWGTNWAIIAIKYAARKGLNGKTIRVWTKTAPVAVTPLTVDIEPKPLNQAEPAFDELYQAFSNEALVDKGRIQRTLARNLSLIGGWPVLLILPVFFLLGVAHFVKGRASSQHVLAIMAICALIILIRLLRAGSPRLERFIVPAALLMRNRLNTGARAGLKLYTRENSVLLAAEQQQRIWSITIADQNGSETFHATPAETDMLLRAWLSPLDPPRLERLKDLD